MDETLSEREQWEGLKDWLKGNGAWIVAGVAVGALALAGWRWWEARQDRLRSEASQKYEQIIAAFDRGDRTQALSLMGELERDHAESPYVIKCISPKRVSMCSPDSSTRRAAGLRAVMEKTQRSAARAGRALAPRARADGAEQA